MVVSSFYFTFLLLLFFVVALSFSSFLFFLPLLPFDWGTFFRVPRSYAIAQDDKRRHSPIPYLSTVKFYVIHDVILLLIIPPTSEISVTRLETSSIRQIETLYREIQN